MKYSLPDFLIDVKTPYEGEKILNSRFSKSVIVGMDEVGRGPLAGPVVACAVVLKKGVEILELNDSKKLSVKKRENLVNEIRSACECYSIAGASVEEIDQINILSATFLAMRRALTAIGVKTNENPSDMVFESLGTLSPELEVLIAVDGNLKISELAPEIQIPVIQGDSRVACISAASVLAKVFRDDLMKNYAQTYPGYGFEKNAGYGTKLHLDGIRKNGFTPIHRKSFHPKSL